MNRPNVWLSIDFDYFVPEDEGWDLGHMETKTGIEFAWTVRLANLRLQKIDLRKEMSLRRARPSPGSFWKLLLSLGYRFDKTKMLVVADSHRWAYFVFDRDQGNGPEPETTRIVHFDAHHDLIYSMNGLNAAIRTQTPECDNWQLMTLLRYPQLESLIVFPAWKGMSDWERLQDRYPNMITDDGREDFNVSARVQPVVWPSPKVAESAGDVERIFICRSGAWVPPWHDRAFRRFCFEAGKTCGKLVDTPFISDEEIDPLAVRKIDYGAVKDTVLLEMSLLGLIGPLARV